MNQTKIYGTDLTLSSTKPTRAGYEFLGWSTSQTATSATYAAGGTFATNADTILYAVWKRTSYTITFNANGGSVSQATKEVVKGETYGELPIPTRTGYSFNGWFTGSATHDNSKAYKDHPWLYYADEYSDLYNAFGYNEESLKNHYNSAGRGEGRRISEYISTDTVDITSNITVYAGWTYDGSPMYTYTGQSTFIDDGNGNWRIKFLTSGTLTITNIASTSIDVFCVGGGGGGGGTRTAQHGYGGGGGGGGKIATYTGISVSTGTQYTITIGAGGAGGAAGSSGSTGGTTSAFGKYAAGGTGGGNGTTNKGGSGGSGGGGGGEGGYVSSRYGTSTWQTPPGAGGSNGGFGSQGYSSSAAGGSGQGTTTGEFGNSSATLYAGGGAGGGAISIKDSLSKLPTRSGGSGGGGASGTAGTANTGGGGGGGNYTSTSLVAGKAGGSGIVVIRNHR